MTDELFSSYMDAFFQMVKERPLLLICDGHGSHVNLDVICKAQRNNCTILKLPAHTSSQLQPLDKFVFRPFKLAWDKTLLNHFRHHGASSYNKAEFVDLVGSMYDEGIKHI